MNTFQKIDHVGIAVSNLNQALKIYQQLGLVCQHRDTVVEQKVNIATLLVGESNLELLEPTEENSSVSKFLNSRGEGIHHLAFQVENIEGKLAELKEAGFLLIDETPRVGAGGAKVAFLHPRGIFGTPIELVQR